MKLERILWPVMVAVVLYLAAVFDWGESEASARKQLPAPSPSPVTLPSPVVSPSPIPLGAHPRLVLKGTVGATPAEIKRLEQANFDSNRVLASDLFKQKVLSATYSENNGMTQAQIYNLISQAPSEITVEIFNGSWWQNHISRTVAFEGTGSQIRLNRYFLGDSKSIGSTYVHERLGHAYGFTHLSGKGVPYGLQGTFQECFTQR